ncbi:MAG: pyruvoyl-dependent arginine decarboxylase [Candidatus Aenigmatarchaeota archaeon]
MKYILSSGIGRSKEPLIAFELALKNAKINKFNLVPVSSILPADCKRGNIDELNALPGGEILFCVLSKHIEKPTKNPFYISAGIMLAESPKQHGYIVEVEGAMNSKECFRRLKYCLNEIFRINNRKLPKQRFYKIATTKTSSKLYTCVLSAVVFYSCD